MIVVNVMEGSCDLHWQYSRSRQLVKVVFLRTQQFSVVALSNASGMRGRTRGLHRLWTAHLYQMLQAQRSHLLPKPLATPTTGREWDSSLELHHFRARWMSGVSGRFISRDPIGYAGGSNNMADYCHCKPIIFLDPNGMQILPPATGSGMPFPWQVPSTPIAPRDLAMENFERNMRELRLAMTRACPEAPQSEIELSLGIFIELERESTKVEEQALDFHLELGLIAVNVNVKRLISQLAHILLIELKQNWG